MCWKFGILILGQFALYREDASRRPFSEIASVFGEHFEKITYMPQFSFTCNLGEYWIQRLLTPDAVTGVDFSSVPSIRAKGKQLFDLLVGDDARVVSCRGTDADLLLGAFRIDSGYVVNITNVTGCIPEGSAVISHHDTIPAFMKSAPKLDSFTLRLRITDTIGRIRLVSPELDCELPLPYSRNGDYVDAVIPGGYFSGYAAVCFDIL